MLHNLLLDGALLKIDQGKIEKNNMEYYAWFCLSM